MDIVIRKFPEKFDGGRRYTPGETYPREGFVPPEGRAEALRVAEKSELNATGYQYLELVDPTEPKPEPAKSARKSKSI